MSALKSGMDRKTARKYLKHPERLGESRPARAWRTRGDPLAAIWRVAEPRLRAASELEAKALFEHLLMIRPEQMRETRLRTFQRRVRQWRLEHGPAPEIIFPQTHRPGEVMQLDWTHAKELEISIAGQATRSIRPKLPDEVLAHGHNRPDQCPARLPRSLPSGKTRPAACEC